MRRPRARIAQCQRCHVEPGGRPSGGDCRGGRRSAAQADRHLGQFERQDPGAETEGGDDQTIAVPCPGLAVLTEGIQLAGRGSRWPSPRRKVDVIGRRRRRLLAGAAACRPCSVSSTGRCTGTIRLDARASSRSARSDRTACPGPAGCAPRRRPARVARSSRADTSRSPTPTRCRPRRRGRSRSAETARPARCRAKPSSPVSLSGKWPW